MAVPKPMLTEFITDWRVVVGMSRKTKGAKGWTREKQEKDDGQG